MTERADYERVVPLDFWLELAERAGVSHIPAAFSPAFPIAELYDALEGDEAPGFAKAMAWAKDELARPGRWMVRWECCADDNVKALACAGAEWSLAWTHGEIDSPRLFDCTAGETTRLCVRPWVDALRIDDYPVEFRVFYGPDGYQGVSNYYPQRALPKMMIEVHAARRLAYRLTQFADFPIGFTADFMVTADDIRLIEGGPPHHMNGQMLPSAHPCCFAPGKVAGVAFALQEGARCA